MKNTGVIHYKVNGEDLTTNKNPLTVREILEKAGSAAGVYKDEIDYYFLEEMRGNEKRYKNSSDLVTVKEGDHFLAIHVGKTPVAWSDWPMGEKFLDLPAAPGDHGASPGP